LRPNCAQNNTNVIAHHEHLNPKHEIPAFAEAASRKQAKLETIQMTKFQMFKKFEFLKFGFVSNFDIRISDFFHSKNLFDSGHAR